MIIIIMMMMMMIIMIIIIIVSWCFKPSQPQRILSGLRETFIKRYIVES